MAEDPLNVLRTARALLDRGDADAARTLVRPLLEAQPDNREALALLANACLVSGDDDGAIAVMLQLQRLDPTHAGVRRGLAAAFNRRGNRQRRDSQGIASLESFRAALAFEPGHAEAGFNLATALDALGLRLDARSALDVHRAQHPDDADAMLLDIEWRWRDDLQGATTMVDALLRHPSVAAADPAGLALACARTGRADAAHEALLRVPAHLRTGLGLEVVDALRARGDVGAATQAAQVAWRASADGQRSPGLKAQLASLALPPIMQSAATIAADRARLQQRLAELDEDWTTTRLATCEPRLEQLAWSNFHLAYHGKPDRELQRAYAQLLERAVTVLFPAFVEPPARWHPRRVGLVSSSWRECTVGAYFGRWIDWLRDAGFEVHLYQLGPQRDAATERFAHAATTFHFHVGPLHELAATIRSDAPNLLIYPELGLDPRLLPLAALRLAPQQAVAWGHPTTTGLSTIDAYLTCAAMEPPDCDAHYTERLLALPGLGVDYTQPPRPAPATRAALGLPDHAPLVLVPHSLFKLHPDDDAVLAGIAARVPDARLVLFEGEHPLWRAQIAARLGASFAAKGLAPARHLLWLPLGSRARFLQINAVCDLMLDSLRWSGGNTSLDALSSGLPILTCPGECMRARQSAAMLERMSLGTDLIRSAPDRLVERACDLLADPSARSDLTRRIVAARDALFGGSDARTKFVEHVERLCGAGSLA